jgi:hypothetical protein
MLRLEEFTDNMRRSGLAPPEVLTEQWARPRPADNESICLARRLSRSGLSRSDYSAYD